MSFNQSYFYTFKGITEVIKAAQAVHYQASGNEGEWDSGERCVALKFE